MSLSQTKRAIEARKWRITKREKRRFNTLLSSYTHVKFGNVYRECMDFYRSLNKKYPEKHDLTKTREYKQWKKQVTNDESSDNETEPASTARQSTSDDNETELASTARQSTSDDNETELASAARQSTSNEKETEPASAARQSTSNEKETEPASAARQSTSDDNETEPVQNILQIAAEDLVPDSIEIRNDIDNIIDEIVRELQHDDDIRGLLNAEMNGELVQPQYMDEDEGIGLNVDVELEAIIEPFDYELEVEGEDW